MNNQIKKTIIVLSLVLGVMLAGYFGISEYNTNQILAQKRKQVASFVNSFGDLNSKEKKFRIEKLDKLMKLNVDNYDWVSKITIIADYKEVLDSINKIQNNIQKTDNGTILEIENLIKNEARAIEQVNNFAPTIECLFNAELKSSQYEHGNIYMVRNRNNPNRIPPLGEYKLEKAEDTQVRLIANHKLFKSCNLTEKNQTIYQKIFDFLDTYAYRYSEILTPNWRLGETLQNLNLETEKIESTLENLKKEYMSSFEYASNQQNSPAYLINIAIENSAKTDKLLERLITEFKLKKSFETGLWE